MLLAIDVGNTQTVIGVFDDTPAARIEREPGTMHGLVHHWRITTVRDRTADEWELELAQLLGLAGFELTQQRDAVHGHERRLITGMSLSSSVPSVTSALRTMFEARTAISLVVVEPGIRTGMPILYDSPKEVGADRIVNSVAALDLYDAPIIVVDLGTATTFDAISASGEYLGGAIVPGIEISMDALFARAAALRRVELVAPKRAIGRTTVEAMQSGAIFGYAALVEGLVARFAQELGESTAIATGGLGGLIAPHAPSICAYEPWLTLHGLRLIYARNHDEGGAPR
ncbi:MAG TPA: type III pantothenate kinase [Acidimicrobiales bacterium]|nr:type III pantothenate kinase [Acidimicrobiales bacterium]